MPDPNIGKRIALSTGFAVNDHQGFERTGYGLLRVNDRYRVVLGLDSRRGEGVVLALYDEGHRGLSVRDSKRSLFLGSAQAGQAPTPKPGPFDGLLLREGDQVKHEVNAAVDAR